MNNKPNAYQTQKDLARGRQTHTLILTLNSLDADRGLAIDVEEWDLVRACNMVISAIIEVLMERMPELDAAIDEWCDDLDGPAADKTIAQFVFDWYRQRLCLEAVGK
jgi:hypothetical protein